MGRFLLAIMVGTICGLVLLAVIRAFTGIE